MNRSPSRVPGTWAPAHHHASCSALPSPVPFPPGTCAMPFPGISYPAPQLCCSFTVLPCGPCPACYFHLFTAPWSPPSYPALLYSSCLFAVTCRMWCLPFLPLAVQVCFKFLLFAILSMSTYIIHWALVLLVFMFKLRSALDHCEHARVLALEEIPYLELQVEFQALGLSKKLLDRAGLHVNVMV